MYLRLDCISDSSCVHISWYRSWAFPCVNRIFTCIDQLRENYRSNYTSTQIGEFLRKHKYWVTTISTLLNSDFGFNKWHFSSEALLNSGLLAHEFVDLSNSLSIIHDSRQISRQAINIYENISSRSQGGAHGNAQS